MVEKNMNMDQILFDYLEGNLTQPEKDSLESLIQSDPQVRAELNEWKSTYMSDKPVPQFSGKKAILKKTSRRYFGLKIGIASSVIIIAGLLIFGINWDSGKPPVTNNIEEPNKIVIQENQDQQHSVEVKTEISETGSKKPVSRDSPFAIVENPPVYNELDENESKVPLTANEPPIVENEIVVNDPISAKPFMAENNPIRDPVIVENMEQDINTEHIDRVTNATPKEVIEAKNLPNDVKKSLRKSQLEKIKKQKRIEKEKRRKRKVKLVKALKEMIGDWWKEAEVVPVD